MTAGRVHCPECGHWFLFEPYDIGSGPEVSCPACEWCWGFNGQPLTPYVPPAGCVTHWPGPGTSRRTDER